jgi:hypothetical protein
VNELIALLKKLVDLKFYGEVLIKFEAGHIALVVKTEKIKMK